MTNYIETKAAVTQAFKALRKRGVIARQSFWCCRGCAGHALGSDPKNQGKPAVLFTKQDQASFERTGEVYIGFGYVNAPEENDEAVGAILVHELRNAGLEVEWDGSENTRVLVKGLTPPPAPATYLDLVGETL